jgi:hypothetical protein
MLAPVLGMQVSDEVTWGPADFLLLAIVLATACSAYELATQVSGHAAYCAAASIAIVTAVLLVWVNLAVGIIGSESNPANLMYAGVLTVGILGAVVARLRPVGMARALVAAALCQSLVGTVALFAGWGSEGANWPGPIVGLTGLFAALWLLSAWLFRRAAGLRALGPR